MPDLVQVKIPASNVIHIDLFFRWQVVIRSNSGDCHNDRNCVKNSENPTGIPAWKIFDFSYWPNHRLGDNAFPMKGKWLLSANPDYGHPDFESSPIQYIG
jgi:hypothetical protein